MVKTLIKNKHRKYKKMLRVVKELKEGVLSRILGVCVIDCIRGIRDDIICVIRGEEYGVHYNLVY